nr:uncharacterized protein LOC112756598 [Arachis hypogaea]
MDTEKVSHISTSGKELMEEDEDRRNSRESEVNMEGSQIPEITVEKIEGIFNFRINEAAIKELRYPWWDTLIVKLLGRRISLLALTRKLEAMWGKMGSIEVIDLGNDNFHYFNPLEATIDKIAAWIRLPGLAIEYYEENMLKKIGNVIGRTLKVDTNTADKSKGKFARLCVELDLTAPLISQYAINGVKYKVEYEGIHNICFSCGLVGHEKSNCLKTILENSEGIEVRVTEKERKGVEGIEKTTTVDRVGEGNPGISKKEKGKQVIEERNEAYGPWMLVQISTRDRKEAKGDNTTGGSGEMEKGANGKGWGSGTRYAVLRTHEDEVELEESTSQQNIPSKQIQVETEALNKENKMITSNGTHNTQNHTQTSKLASPTLGYQPNPTNPKPKKTFNSTSEEPITTQKIHEPIITNPGPLPSPFNPVPNKLNNIATSETKIVKN